MTPRERYMAVLHGGRPDVLPRVPILMQFAAEYIGSYYGAFDGRRWRQPSSTPSPPSSAGFIHAACRWEILRME